MTVADRSVSQSHAQRSDAGSAHGGAPAREENPLRDLPYLRYGIPTGLVGAGVVAVFFLVVDLVAGQPLATPSALGATLFRGEPMDLSAPISGVLVLGYTMMHAAIFIAIACTVAVVALSVGRPRTPSFPFWLKLAAVAFLACEAFFVLLALLVEGSVWADLGFVNVTVANALAGASMGAALMGFAAQPPGAEEPEADPSLQARQHRDEPEAIHQHQHQSPTAAREEPADPSRGGGSSA